MTKWLLLFVLFLPSCGVIGKVDQILDRIDTVYTGVQAEIKKADTNNDGRIDNIQEIVLLVGGIITLLFGAKPAAKVVGKVATKMNSEKS